MTRALALLLSAWLALFPAQVSAQNSVISAPAGAAKIPNYTANGGLPKWTLCRNNKIKAATGNCKILIVCESSCVWGAGWQTNDYGDAYNVTWPAQLAQILSTQYSIPASANSVFGWGLTSSSPTIAQYQAMNPMATIGAGWAPTTGFFASFLSLGGAFWVNGTNTNPWAYDCSNTGQFPNTQACQTDTFVYFPLLSNAGDTTTISVNGGAALRTITDNISSVAPISTTTTLAHNVWDIKCTSAPTTQCLFYGFYAYNSAISQALILNAGWAGSTVVAWNTNNPEPSDPIPAIKAVAPDLCLIQIAGNDAADGTNLTTYSTDTQNLITACQISGDAMIVASQPNAPSNVSYATMSTYIAALVTLATTDNIPIYSIWNYTCNFSTPNCLNGGWANMNQGWGAQNFGNADTTDPHMGPPLHAIIAKDLAAVLAN